MYEDTYYSLFNLSAITTRNIIAPHSCNSTKKGHPTTEKTSASPGKLTAEILNKEEKELE